jgi:hypothetical protein
MQSAELIELEYETIIRGEDDSSKPRCPGFVIRSNAAGFQWRQVCDCCPHRPAIYYQVSYQIKM